MNWEDRLTAAKLIPVIVLDDAARAGDVGAALLDGGLAVAEVTLRTDAALDAIRGMARHEDLFVGAGTVLTAEQVDRAVDAGASFIVSPGLSFDVVRRAQVHGVPVLPGVATPTDVMAALSLGLTLLKFFPAGCYGGRDTIKAFASPFGNARFVPTGGVNEDNLASYLQLPNVPAVGGSWMVAPKLIRDGAFDQIAQLCRTAATIAAAA